MSPYRVTNAPIIERRIELDALLGANGKVITFKTNDPKRFRYRLNEALNAAKALEIEPWCNIRVKLRVEPPYVHAIPVHNIVIETEVVSSTVHINTDNTRIFDNAITEFDVVQCIKDNPELVELHFPKFIGNIKPIHTFATIRGYEVIVDPVLIIRRISNDNA